MGSRKVNEGSRERKNLSLECGSSQSDIWFTINNRLIPFAHFAPLHALLRVKDSEILVRVKLISIHGSGKGLNINFITE